MPRPYGTYPNPSLKREGLVSFPSLKGRVGLGLFAGQPAPLPAGSFSLSAIPRRIAAAFEFGYNIYPVKNNWPRFLPIPGSQFMLTSLIALLTALLIDRFLGDPPNRFHPVVAMGSFIRLSARKPHAGSPFLQFLRGLGLILLGGLIFALPWVFLTPLIHRLPFWLSGVLLGLLLKPVFSIRRLLEAGMEVHTALANGDLPEARRLVSWHLVSRDTSRLSAGQAASATIESLAENLTDSFIAPVLAFVLGGLPLAWLYRFVNTADAMIGYRSPQYEYLGKFAARLDDILNWLPARLSALILATAAGLSRLDAGNAWRVALHQHGRTASPNAGWSMAAAAGALRVRLEKVDTYRLDGGDDFPGLEDIPGALRLVRTAVILGWILCGGLLIGIDFIF
ncbi:MAG: adenosylcobinamide-phosphate synthase CbiB [Anaerolineaceae bacterium]